MKNGCYEFGFYGDLALRVDNESNVYEFMTYDYHSRLNKRGFNFCVLFHYYHFINYCFNKPYDGLLFKG